jgi:hypothetical protein
MQKTVKYLKQKIRETKASLKRNRAATNKQKRPRIENDFNILSNLAMDHIKEAQITKS